MGREIYIDGARIGQAISGAELRITVDDEVRSSPVPSDLHGRYAIPWKKRQVELRRIGGRAPETEVWVDGVKMPWSEVGPAEGAPKKCGPHGKLSRRRCAACDAALCLRDLAPDGVRCAECFERARVEQPKERRATLLKLAGFAFAVAALMSVGGAFTEGSLSRALQYGVGGAFAGFFGFLFSALRKPEAGAVGPLREDLRFEVDDEGPQLVGSHCAACKKRIGWAGVGCFCPRCRKVLHKDCEKEHPCKPPARGPDLKAMRKTTRKTTGEGPPKTET